MNYKDKFIDLVDRGLFDRDQAILMLVKYMSDDDVKGCLQANEVEAF